MSIQPYVGPTPGSNNGAIVALGTAQEISPEEYERRQKEVRSPSAACSPALVLQNEAVQQRLTAPHFSCHLGMYQLA